MSVQTEIERIRGNISGAYEALEAKGAAMPETKNSENLAQVITDMPAPYTQVVGPAGRVSVSNTAGTINVYPSKVTVEDGKLVLHMTVSGNATKSAIFNGTGTVDIRF